MTRREIDLTGRQPQEPLPPDWFAPLTEEEASRVLIGSLDAGNSAEADRIVRIVAVAFLTVCVLMLALIWFFVSVEHHAPPAGEHLLAPPASAKGDRL